MGRALLVIDMLNDFVEEGGSLYVGEASRNIIPFIKQKIEEFKKEKCPVIFICDSHEKDDREFEMFPPHCISGTWGSMVIKELEPAKEDKVIKKRRYSAFYGTDLDLYLRERGINELYLVGVCTNICVLYTAKDARERGYSVKIYRDGVASFDKSVHEFALQEMKNTLGCELI